MQAKKKEGNDAFGKKDYEAAIGFYGEAIELDPQNHIYYSNRRCAPAATAVLPTTNHCYHLNTINPPP